MGSLVRAIIVPPAATALLQFWRNLCGCAVLGLFARSAALAVYRRANLSKQTTGAHRKLLCRPRPINMCVEHHATWASEMAYIKSLQLRPHGHGLYGRPGGAYDHRYVSGGQVPLQAYRGFISIHPGKRGSIMIRSGRMLEALSMASGPVAASKTS
jgi:hypothetical protein